MLNRILLFITAVFLGSLLEKMHLPIPYMLGGIIAALLCKCFSSRINVSWPEKWRAVGMMIAGYGIGCSFNSAALATFWQEAVGTIGGNLLVIVISVVFSVLVAKLTKINIQSCVMGMMPGGIAMMMLMAEEDKKVNPNAVIVMQVIRLLGVIVTVPFLVITLLDAQVTGSSFSLPPNNGIHWLVCIPLIVLGKFIAQKLHLPMPIFLGPILATDAFSILAGQLQPVPGMIMAAAQISIGLYMGLLLDGPKLLAAKKVIPLTVIGTVILIAVSVGMGYLLSVHYGFSLITAFLAMAPGGIAEMTLAGLSMGEDVTVILTYQMVRILMINLCVPPVLNWYFQNK